MRSTNNSFADDGFTWDGSRKKYRPRWSLRVAEDSPSRLLRTAQSARCDLCGNPIEWYQRPGSTAVPLHPVELPAASVPPGERWHVSSGVAHASHDGSAWCWVRHHALCPAGAAGKHGNRLPGPIDEADARLAYVAVTRARTRLDLGGLEWINDHPDGNP